MGTEHVKLGKYSLLGEDIIMAFESWREINRIRKNHRDAIYFYANLSKELSGEKIQQIFYKKSVFFSDGFYNRKFSQRSFDPLSTYAHNSGAGR